MNIALVSIHPYRSAQSIPLAAAFLKAAVTYRDVAVTLPEFYCTETAAATAAAGLIAMNPAAVGFSVYVWNSGLCAGIAQELRRRAPHIAIFAGGPEATAAPGTTIAGGYDFVIVGEGEIPFAEVCGRLRQGQPVQGIPGVATLHDGRLELLPAPPVADLDAIRSPWLSGCLDANAYRGILWQISRGCSFGCDFCFDSQGRRVRRFSLERIEAELRLFAGSGVEQVFVLDSTFNQDRKRAKTILRLIRKLAPHIHFHFEVRSEFIDVEMARLFSGIHCSLQIGLQSADPAVLQAVGRSFDRDDFTEKIALLNETGAVFGFDLIYGLPGDTPAGFSASLDFALQRYPNHLDIFPLAVLPGTALHRRGAETGLVHQLEPPYTLISSPTFSEQQMAQAGELALACDLFYTRGTAVAWFNSVARNLRLQPAHLLALFAEWLRQNSDVATAADVSENDIWRMQRAFLTELYRRQQREKMLALVLDLVDYHHAYAAALQHLPPEPPPEELLQHPGLMELTGHLAPSAQLAPFSYEILDILAAGEPEIADFVTRYGAAGSWAVIYPAADGIRTESLVELYYRLLERLRHPGPLGKAAEAAGLDAEDALSFLQFAIAEGIVLLKGC